MVRLSIALLAAVVLLASELGAQVKGVAASVNSQPVGARTYMPRGPAASVTSLGPEGFQSPRGFDVPCCDPGLVPPGGFAFGPRVFHGRSKAHFPVVVPIYYPYLSPVYVPVVVEQEPYELEPEPPAPTIFERRSRTEHRPVYRQPAAPADEDERYGERFFEPSERGPAAEEREEKRAEQPAMVLVYRDGRREEVRNYAIMGDYLYDLEAPRSHKVPLAELDLEATVKANEELGLDFALPKRRKG